MHFIILVYFEFYFVFSNDPAFTSLAKQEEYVELRFWYLENTLSDEYDRARASTEGKIQKGPTEVKLNYYQCFIA